MPQRPTSRLRKFLRGRLKNRRTEFTFQHNVSNACENVTYGVVSARNNREMAAVVSAGTAGFGASFIFNVPGLLIGAPIGAAVGYFASGRGIPRATKKASIALKREAVHNSDLRAFLQQKHVNYVKVSGTGKIIGTNKKPKFGNAQWIEAKTLLSK